MFTTADREALKGALITAAEEDPRVAAAALLGSSAEGAEDEWSDIDLALGVAPAADLDAVVAAWTARMYERHGAVHQLDIVARGALYRVFLLADTLQVDLSFWPTGEFRARGPRFRLLFGAADPAEQVPAPSIEHLAGMSWIYLLHARSSIARGRELQARFWLSGARDQILALACAVHGLPTNEARGADDLPDAIKREALAVPVAPTDREEAGQALRALIDLLRNRLQEADPSLATRLDPTLRTMLTGRKPLI